MSPPTAQGAVEAPALLGNGVGVQSLERTSRKVTNDAVKVLMDLGYRDITRKQALRLIHEYHEWRADDARSFVAAEFQLYVQRRGDLMQVRGKRNHGWRTHT